MNDDHGDRFPGALPTEATSAPSRPAGAEERLVRMHAAYAQKINSAVQADREDLAHELATTTFAEDPAVDLSDHDLTRERRTAGRRSPDSTRGGRPPGQAPTGLTRMGRFTRRSLDRFDRYTLEVFNPGSPYRSPTDT
ncbi:hypothetical protein [Blastococcus sp. CT_GayMR16]|uniref:hypothetical protein n=1 Tax=Blastococcus sp. CT_GayMR16 TaxID=2559607 RepID=UPI001073E1B1|nr:hypothetical protein [Blastococcus sp. CT_GayMR16]TFV89498.1 hypothetical protein E4P38_06895 [Blastococcus sp. CT_GayMR16]